MDNGSLVRRLISRDSSVAVMQRVDSLRVAQIRFYAIGMRNLYTQLQERTEDLVKLKAKERKRKKTNKTIAAITAIIATVAPLFINK